MAEGCRLVVVLGMEVRRVGRGQTSKRRKLQRARQMGLAESGGSTGIHLQYLCCHGIRAKVERWWARM